MAPQLAFPLHPPRGHTGQDLNRCAEIQLSQKFPLKRGCDYPILNHQSMVPGLNNQRITLLNFETYPLFLSALILSVI